MDKNYEILSQDRVFENNIIVLGYDYEETLEVESGGGASKCARPNASSDPIDFARSSSVSTSRQVSKKTNRNTRKDVVLGSLNVDDYSTDYAVSTTAGINDKSGMKSFIQSSSTSTKLEACVNLCDGANGTSKDHVEVNERIESTREDAVHSCTTYVLPDVIRRGQLDVEPEQKCVTDLEPEAKRRNKGSERSENCFINEEEINCLDTHQVTQEADKDLPFKIKFIEKDNSINMNTNDQEERPCIENRQPTTVSQTTDITVGSNLQFLNTGESIVVLTQDVNNIGFPSSMVSQIVAEFFEFSETRAIRN